MTLKRLSCLLAAVLLALSLLPSQALAAPYISGLEIEPYAGGFSYSFFCDEEYVLFFYKTSVESGRQLLHSTTGLFSGQFALPCTEQPERLKVEMESLKGLEIGSGSAITEYNPLPVLSVPHHPSSEVALRARNLTMVPVPGGVQVDFDLPGYDKAILKYKTSQQSGELPFYGDENYHFSCAIDLPLAYAGSNVYVSVYLPRKDDPVGETEGKRGYVLEAKVAETAPEGRLHGVTVCLDPGHSDLLGPSAEYISPDSDEMAITNPGLCGQGHFTFRRESIVVLEIAYLLRDVLRAQGAEVVMTREDEYTWITSVPRADLAYEAGADFMLRLHADDRDEEDLRGVQVFCPLSSSYAQAVATPQEYRAMGEALMFTIRDACGYTERTPGCRVVLNDNYVGNNWARVPCFLLEMGYLSNRQDDLLLSHPDYQQLLAESIADGIYEMALLRDLVAW